MAAVGGCSCITGSGSCFLNPYLCTEFPQDLQDRLVTLRRCGITARHGYRRIQQGACSQEECRIGPVSLDNEAGDHTVPVGSGSVGRTVEMSAAGDIEYGCDPVSGAECLPYFDPEGL